MILQRLLPQYRRCVVVVVGLSRRSNIRCGITSPTVAGGSVGVTVVYTSKRWKSDELPLQAIVKVNTIATTPHFYLPWQRKASKPSSGSGFIVETNFGRSLITNAHVVADATYLSVRRCQSAVSYKAQVEAISHESDLALLTVEDDAFWNQFKDSSALKLGRLPRLQEHVNVIGFPAGGDGVSVTRGVVSRIEPIQYSHGGIHLLGIQIDASINPGNSGGPALIENAGDEDHVVGVAFQSLAGADNIGYIIPTPVINHFLTQYHLHKKYSGFPQLGILWQPLENPSIRMYYHLDTSTTGILVTHVSPVSPASSVLKADDVILSIDGTKIADNGTVDFHGGERVFLNYLFVNKFVGDTCCMEIMRNGEKLSISFPLVSSRTLSLVQLKTEGIPSYLIYGGLVFTKLTIPYLREFESEDQENWHDVAPRALVYKAIYGYRENAEQEIVILSHVLADNLNHGYTNFYNVELEKFNGEKVNNLKQLFRMIHSSEEKFARFDFLDKSVIILETEAVKNGNDTILQEYSIHKENSQDLGKSDKRKK